MNEKGIGFLVSKYPDLHHSDEVGAVVNYLNGAIAYRNHKSAAEQSAEKRIPNEPKAIVAAYLGFMATVVGDPFLVSASSHNTQRQLEHFVIPREKIPEAYIEKQVHALAQNLGDHNELPDPEDIKDAAISDQFASLNAWVTYLNDTDSPYPEWFKFYVMENVTKLSDYDKRTGKFKRRTKGKDAQRHTVARYPDLNPEALALAYEAIVAKHIDGRQLDDVTLQPIVEGANFNNLYSKLYNEVSSNNEVEKSLDGAWVKFTNNQEDAAKTLSESLKGKNTGWCIAGESFAQRYLDRGDFYIYYSIDKNGGYSVPRASVRTQDGKLAEISGIEQGQSLEAAMLDIAQAKADELNLPGTKEFMVTFADARMLHEILQKNGEGQALTKEELIFMYEIERRFTQFGYQRDYQAVRFFRGRDMEADLQEIFDVDDIEEVMTGHGKDTARIRTRINTAILDRIIAKASEKEQLTVRELRFLYELDTRIKYFVDMESHTHQRERLIQERDVLSDLLKAYDVTSFDDIKARLAVYESNDSQQAKAYRLAKLVDTIQLQLVSQKIEAGAELSRQELTCIYEIEGYMRCIGDYHQKNAKILHVLRNRNVEQDLLMIFDVENISAVPNAKIRSAVARAAYDTFVINQIVAKIESEQELTLQELGAIYDKPQSYYPLLSANFNNAAFGQILASDRDKASDLLRLTGSSSIEELSTKLYDSGLSWRLQSNIAEVVKSDRDEKLLGPIEQKLANGIELSRDDLATIYGYNPSGRRSFTDYLASNYSDKRVKALLATRNAVEDIAVIYDIDASAVATSIDGLNDDTVVYMGDVAFGKLKKRISDYSNLQAIYGNFKLNSMQKGGGAKKYNTQDAIKLIELGFADEVLTVKDKFYDFDEAAVLASLQSTGELEKNVTYLKKLSPEFATKGIVALIEANALHGKNFPSIDFDAEQVADALITNGATSRYVLTDRFAKTLASKLCAMGDIDTLATLVKDKNISVHVVSMDIGKESLVDVLVSSGEFELAVSALATIPRELAITSKTTMSLIEAGFGEQIITYASAKGAVFTTAASRLLLKQGFGTILATQPHLFAASIVEKAVAEQPVEVLTSDEFSVTDITDSVLAGKKKLTTKVLDIIIAAGEGSRLVAKHRELAIDPRYLTEGIIKSGKGYTSVIYNMHLLAPEITPADIKEILIANNRESIVELYEDYFL